jgi:hypothetical protein
MPTLATKSLLFSLLRSACLLASLILPTTKPLSAQTAADDQPDRVHGTVVNTVTHEPIARALVVSQDNRFATMTDDRGRFELPFPKPEPNPPPNARGFSAAVQVDTNVIQLSPQLVLMARKPGYLQRAEGQATIVVDPAHPDVVIGLVPEAHIVGRVVFPGSSDAADHLDSGPIKISLLRRIVHDGRLHWVTSAEATTRSNGEFRFYGLTAGAYKLVTQEMLDRDPERLIPGAQMWGFPPVSFPSMADADSATGIRLSAGQTFEPTLSLARREYYRVNLPVINAQAGSGYEVFVWPVADPGPGYSLGFYDLNNTVSGSLPNGTYTLKLVGFNGEDGSGMTTLHVRGADVNSPSITIAPNPRISIVIHEEFSKSSERHVPRADGSFSQVYRAVLIPDDGDGFQREIPAAITSSGNQPFYAFEQVPPGRYRVKVYSGSGYAASIRAGSTELLHQPLVVGVGSAPPSIEVVMRDDGATVAGELIAPAAKDLSGLQPSGWMPHPVYFLPVADAGMFTTVWTSPDGKFAAPNLPPGTYKVLGFDHQQPELEQEGEPDLHAYESQSQEITVSANQTPKLRVPMIVVPE